MGEYDVQLDGKTLIKATPFNTAPFEESAVVNLYPTKSVLVSYFQTLKKYIMLTFFSFFAHFLLINQVNLFKKLNYQISNQRRLKLLLNLTSILSTISKLNLLMKVLYKMLLMKRN